jgi:hypothetical protein
MKPFLLAIVALSFITGCDKGTSAPPNPATSAKCTIKSEYTGLSGNERSFIYDYDANGNPSKVNVLYPNGSTAYTYEIGSNSIVIKGSYLGKPTRNITRYNVSDITLELPSRADVSVDDGDTLRVNYYSYFFFYNSKKQLIKVGEQTNYVIGDNEYDLNIFYNAQGNVTALQYEWTTGPNQVIPPVTVNAYDDKPTPYSALKAMPFLLINYSWNNYDPEPILTALSKNNPLDYSLGTGVNLWKREMVYQYNPDGFPTVRKNTNKNVNGEYTFLQTFSYNCK